MNEPEMTPEQEEAAFAELGMSREEWEASRERLSGVMTEMTKGGTFLIYCDERSHANRIAKIQTLHLSALARPSTATTLLEGNAPLARPTLRDAIFGADGRTVRQEPPRAHYKFRCKLCTLDVSVPGERLWEIVDTLTRHGKSTVSLSTLGAIVRGRKTFRVGARYVDSQASSRVQVRPAPEVPSARQVSSIAPSLGVAICRR